MEKIKGEDGRNEDRLLKTAVKVQMQMQGGGSILMDAPNLNFAELEELAQDRSAWKQCIHAKFGSNTMAMGSTGDAISTREETTFFATAGRWIGTGADACWIGPLPPTICSTTNSVRDATSSAVNVSLRDVATSATNVPVRDVSRTATDITRGKTATKTNSAREVSVRDDSFFATGRWIGTGADACWVGPLPLNFEPTRSVAYSAIAAAVPNRVETSTSAVPARGANVINTDDAGITRDDPTRDETTTPILSALAPYFRPTTTATAACSHQQQLKSLSRFFASTPTPIPTPTKKVTLSPNAPAFTPTTKTSHSSTELWAEPAPMPTPSPTTTQLQTLTYSTPNNELWAVPTPTPTHDSGTPRARARARAAVRSPRQQLQFDITHTMLWSDISPIPKERMTDIMNETYTNQSHHLILNESNFNITFLNETYINF